MTWKQSKKIADKLLVIVNNDEQAILKKGKAFMLRESLVRVDLLVLLWFVGMFIGMEGAMDS